MINYRKKFEQDVANHVKNDLAEHQIIVMREDGLYRHYRCENPKSGFGWFDIVTWPGSLCYTGDMGDYLFQRTEDMIAFMRGSCMSFDYAAEKCVAGETEEFREELLYEELDYRLKEGGDDEIITYPWKGKQSVKELIEEVKYAYNRYQNPHDAYTAMHETGLYDSCDMPECKYFTFRFLWCLHAIKWFCENLDVKLANNQIRHDAICDN